MNVPLIKTLFIFIEFTIIIIIPKFKFLIHSSVKAQAITPEIIQMKATAAQQIKNPNNEIINNFFISEYIDWCRCAIRCQPKIQVSIIKNKRNQVPDGLPRFCCSQDRILYVFRIF